MFSTLLNLPNRDDVYMERHTTAEEFPMSGSHDVNLIRMISDHAPTRVTEISKEIDRHQERIEKLRQEMNTLVRLLNVLDEDRPLPF